MKNIRVSAAVIHDGSSIFATERGYGEWKGKWEFPGGKREEGENGEDTVKREIMEELETRIEVEDFLCTVAAQKPVKFSRNTLSCYIFQKLCIFIYRQ